MVTLLFRNFVGAAQDGDIETIKELFKAGMSVDSRDGDNYTPLHWAAKCGRLELVQFLISQKDLPRVSREFLIDLKAEDGSTAVLLAAESGHKSIVDLLLREGADIGGRSKFLNWTLLHYAARAGWTDTVKSLVENKNSELDAQTRLGMTPLLLAASEDHTDVIELLIEAGANVRFYDSSWQTVLDFAAINGWAPLVKKIVTVDKLSVNWEGKKGVPALLLAAKYGHQEVVEILIDAGAFIHVRDFQKCTVLHYAGKKGWLQVVKKVLKMNAIDIDAKNEQGNTALHFAYGMNNMTIVKELLKAGANASIENERNETALFGKTIHQAAGSGDIERLEYLMKLGMSTETCNHRNGYTPLHCAASKGQLKVGQFLIHNNCNLNPITNKNFTPLLVAGFHGDEKFVALLIESGADVSICQCCTKMADVSSHYFCSKMTILHTACKNNWIDIIGSILEKKNVDIEAKTNLKLSPLIFAVLYNHSDATKLLLQAGANVHSCNDQGETSLHLACRLDIIDVEIVKTLLSSGADPNLKNADDNTPFHVAIEKREPYLEAIKLLIKHGAYFRYSDSNKISENSSLKELVLNDIDLCTQLIINKFNRQSLPTVYKNPEYVEKLPRMNKMNIGKTEGVRDGIAACVQSEMERKSYCDVMKIRPTVLTLMCVEALIKPQPIQKKISRQALNIVKGPVKRTARLASLDEGSSKKKCSN